MKDFIVHIFPWRFILNESAHLMAGHAKSYAMSKLKCAVGVRVWITEVFNVDIVSQMHADPSNLGQ